LRYGGTDFGITPSQILPALAAGKSLPRADPATPSPPALGRHEPSSPYKPAHHRPMPIPDDAHPSPPGGFDAARSTRSEAWLYSCGLLCARLVSSVAGLCSRFSGPLSVVAVKTLPAPRTDPAQNTAPVQHHVVRTLDQDQIGRVIVAVIPVHVVDIKPVP